VMLWIVLVDTLACVFSFALLVSYNRSLSRQPSAV
jgi:hypothetical protein